MDIYEICGTLGSILISFQLLPQLLHTYKVKNTVGLSLKFILINALVCILYIIFGYGVYEMSTLKGLPILLSNSTLLICDIILLYMVKIYKNNAVKNAEDNFVSI